MKIGIIIEREYLTRVKKRSFLLITFLAPIFFAALMFLPGLLMLNSEKFDSKKTIAVCDESTLFTGKFKDTDVNTFIYEEKDITDVKNLVREGVYDGVLYIPGTSLTLPVNAEIYSMNQIPMTLTDYINTTMKTVIEHQKLLASGIDPDIVKAANTTIHVQAIRMSEDENVEKKSFGEFEFLLGIALAMVIYFVIFIFGSQVMRGVIEEKTNRIIEVIISSVKPFELMMGKIIGIALVGLTQFLLWGILTTGIYVAVAQFLPTQEVFSTGTVMTEQIAEAAANTDTEQVLTKVFDVIHSINFKAILWCFLFYFIGGYFLYSAMFAAVGSAVDNETDTQQFVTPISMLLIIPMVCSTIIANAPDSSLSLWLSMIPFTSPVAMMLRIPFGVPIWQVVTSVALLFVTFIIFTWLAGKVYRTGILMYGKKVSWKEIIRWIKY
ncbi:MAG: ABC transporter permease [Bacteroidales bacterium]|nr:ABC transporter permease [Bacteroidales bacterium]